MPSDTEGRCTEIAAVDAEVIGGEIAADVAADVAVEGGAEAAAETAIAAETTAEITPEASVFGSVDFGAAPEFGSVEFGAAPELGSVEISAVEPFGTGTLAENEGQFTEFFARMDAECTQSWNAGPSVTLQGPMSGLGRVMTNIAENAASWTQLAKWGAETLAGAAIHEAARIYAEEHANLPSYSR
ncbi:MAG: hypothetical protein WAS24_08340 [Thermoplasmata archaeon]